MLERLLVLEELLERLDVPDDEGVIMLDEAPPLEPPPALPQPANTTRRQEKTRVLILFMIDLGFIVRSQLRMQPCPRWGTAAPLP